MGSKKIPMWVFIVVPIAATVIIVAIGYGIYQFESRRSRNRAPKILSIDERNALIDEQDRQTYGDEFMKLQKEANAQQHEALRNVSIGDQESQVVHISGGETVVTR